jgi:hypothetical protein
MISQASRLARRNRFLLNAGCHSGGHAQITAGPGPGAIEDITTAEPSPVHKPPPTSSAAVPASLELSKLWPAVAGREKAIATVDGGYTASDRCYVGTRGRLRWPAAVWPWHQPPCPVRLLHSSGAAHRPWLHAASGRGSIGSGNGMGERPVGESAPPPLTLKHLLQLQQQRAYGSFLQAAVDTLRRKLDPGYCASPCGL